MGEYTWTIRVPNSQEAFDQIQDKLFEFGYLWIVSGQFKQSLPCHIKDNGEKYFLLDLYDNGHITFHYKYRKHTRILGMAAKFKKGGHVDLLNKIRLGETSSVFLKPLSVRPSKQKEKERNFLDDNVMQLIPMSEKAKQLLEIRPSRPSQDQLWNNVQSEIDRMIDDFDIPSDVADPVFTHALIDEISKRYYITERYPETQFEVAK